MATVILPPTAYRGCCSVARCAGFTGSPDATARLRRRLRLVTETRPLPTKLAGAETKLEIDQKISRRWPTSKRAALRLPNHMSSQGFRGAWLRFWAPTWLTQAQEVLGVGRSVRRVQQRRYRQSLFTIALWNWWFPRPVDRLDCFKCAHLRPSSRDVWYIVRVALAVYHPSAIGLQLRGLAAR